MGLASCLRRMRTVIGSSADAARRAMRWGVLSTLFVAFSALIRSASSETLGPSRPPFSRPALDSPALSRSRRPVNSDRYASWENASPRRP